jgi:hypothetical protein
MEKNCDMDSEISEKIYNKYFYYFIIISKKSLLKLLVKRRIILEIDDIKKEI